MDSQLTLDNPKQKSANDVLAQVSSAPSTPPSLDPRQTPSSIPWTSTTTDIKQFESTESLTTPSDESPITVPWQTSFKPVIAVTTSDTSSLDQKDSINQQDTRKKAPEHSEISISTSRTITMEQENEPTATSDMMKLANESENDEDLPPLIPNYHPRKPITHTRSAFENTSSEMTYHIPVPAVLSNAPVSTTITTANGLTIIRTTPETRQRRLQLSRRRQRRKQVVPRAKSSNHSRSTEDYHNMDKTNEMETTSNLIESSDNADFNVEDASYSIDNEKFESKNSQQEPCRSSSQESVGGDRRELTMVSSENQQEKKRRRRVSPEQLRELTAAFEHSDTPGWDLREALAQRLDMSNREIQVWFQNRRAKINRLRQREKEQRQQQSQILLSNYEADMDIIMSDVNHNGNDEYEEGYSPNKRLKRYGNESATSAAVSSKLDSTNTASSPGGFNRSIKFQFVPTRFTSTGKPVASHPGKRKNVPTMSINADGKHESGPLSSQLLLHTSVSPHIDEHRLRVDITNTTTTTPTNTNHPRNGNDNDPNESSQSHSTSYSASPTTLVPSSGQQAVNSSNPQISTGAPSHTTGLRPPPIQAIPYQSIAPNLSSEYTLMSDSHRDGTYRYHYHRPSSPSFQHHATATSKHDYYYQRGPLTAPLTDGSHESMSHPVVYPPLPSVQPPPPPASAHPIPYRCVLPPPLPSPTSATYPPVGPGSYSAGLPHPAQVHPPPPPPLGAAPSVYYSHPYVASAPVSPMYYRVSSSRASPGHGGHRDPHHISPTLLPPPSGYRPHGPPAGVEVPQQSPQSTPPTSGSMNRCDSNASITAPYPMEHHRLSHVMMEHRRHPSLEGISSTRMISPLPLSHFHPPVGYAMVPYPSPMAATQPPPPPGTYCYDGASMAHPLSSPYYYYPPRPVVAAPLPPPSSSATTTAGAGASMIPTGTSPRSSLTVIEENGYQSSGSKTRTPTTVSSVSSQTSTSMLSSEPQFRASWRYTSSLNNSWMERPARYQRRRSEPNLCRVSMSKSTTNTTLPPPSYHERQKSDDDSMAVLASAASYVSHHDDSMVVEKEASSASIHGSNKVITSSKLDDNSKSLMVTRTDDGGSVSSSTATMVASASTSLSPSIPPPPQSSLVVDITNVKVNPWSHKSGVTTSLPSPALTASSPDGDDRRHTHQHHHTNTTTRMAREHDNHYDYPLTEVNASTNRSTTITSATTSEHNHGGSFHP